MLFLLEVDLQVQLEIDVSLHSSRPDVHAYTWRTWSSCSFEVDPPGDLHDVVVWERTAGIEVVTALSSDPPDELTHVRRVAVLRRGGHTHRPDEVDEVCLGGGELLPGGQREQLAHQLWKAVDGDCLENLVALGRNPILFIVRQFVCCVRWSAPARHLSDDLYPGLREQEDQTEHRHHPAPLKHPCYWMF